jgi:hypothetical protein
MLSRLIPWLDVHETEEHEQLRAEIADMEREQHELAPFIAEQTAYLVHRGQLNGFTRQLRLGFQQRPTEQ